MKMMTTTSINEKLSEMYALLSKASLISTAPSLFEFIKEIFVNTSEYSIGTMNVLDDDSVISVSIGEDTLILQDSTEEEVYDKLSSFIDTRIEELKDLISKNEVVISDEDIPSLPETEGEVLIDPEEEPSEVEPSSDEEPEEPSNDEEPEEPSNDEPSEETAEEDDEEDSSDVDEAEPSEEAPADEEEPTDENVEAPNIEPTEEASEDEPSDEEDEPSDEEDEPSDEEDEPDYIPSTVRNADSDLEEEPLEPSDDDPDYIPSTLRNIEEEPEEEPLEPTEGTDILTLIDEEETSPDTEETSSEEETSVEEDEEETSPEDDETSQKEDEEETSSEDDEDEEETSSEDDEDEEETSPSEDKSDLQKKLFEKAFISGKDAITAIDNGLNGPVNVPFSNPSYAQQRRSDELRKRANLSFLKR